MADRMITTVSGVFIDPLDVDPDLISIEDAAYSLARQCRYNGHVGGWLSVARHSLWVSEVCPPEHARWGLLHDLTEAMLGDVVSPVKHSPPLAGYRDLEAGVEKAVALAFSLPWPMPDAVHEADHLINALEVVPVTGARWTWCSTPANDEAEFLATFDALTLEAISCP